MTASRRRRFAIPALGIAVVAGALSWGGAGAAGLGAGEFLLAGFAVAALPGVAGGAWLAGRWGSPGPGFYGGMVAAMAFRFVAVGIGTVVGLRSGGDAPWAFLLGFAATFVPLTVYEAIWFRRESAAAERG